MPSGKARRLGFLLEDEQQGSATTVGWAVMALLRRPGREAGTQCQGWYLAAPTSAQPVDIGTRVPLALTRIA